MTDNVSVYVADLAAYNNGKLHGVWIELEPGMTADEIMEQVQEMLDDSPEDDAEEWAIHAEEGLNFGEFAGLDELVRFCEVWDGDNLDIIVALIDQHGDDYGFSLVEEGSYMVHGSWDDIIDSWMDTWQIPDHIRFYIDEDAVRRDLELERSYAELRDGRVIESLD